jgi:hypothetical protein
MKQKFVDTVVICTAVLSFIGGGGILVNTASALVDLRVNSVLDTKAAAASSAADEQPSALGQVTKKLMHLLK